MIYFQVPKTVLSPSATSRMDFKRLLLQQSIKTGPTRVSATEQLKLSRQQCQEAQQLPQTPPPPKPPQQIPLTKVLSPRSAWRFQTPRTDVLSSTIIEDAAAEEKAMKPSPENPSPVSRLPTSTRRQLELGHEELKNAINESKRPMDKRDKELENRLQLIDAEDHAESCSPVKAIESRRMSNQLARAQFLAGGPSSQQQQQQQQQPKDLFGRRFRARSESPQQNAHQRNGDASGVSASAVTGSQVTRSPSAPALETAL